MIGRFFTALAVLAALANVSSPVRSAEANAPSLEPPRTKRCARRGFQAGIQNRE
jgi:hypothetical protein